MKGKREEGGRNQTHRTKPTYRPAVQTKETIGGFLESGLGGSEGGRGQGISAVENERERASCLPIGGGGSGGRRLRISSFFSARSLARSRSSVFYFVLDGRADEWVETEARRVPPCRPDAVVGQGEAAAA
jgi:hypothetical protein